MQVRLFDAEAKDAALIQQLAREIWPQVFADILSAEQIAYMLDLMYKPARLKQQMHDGIRYILAEIDGEVSAFSGFEVNYKGSARTRIHKLYLRPALHGKGIGREFIMKISHEAWAHGDSSLELNVNRYNPAVAFYKKMGFLVEREEDIPLGNGYLMEDYVMVLPLAKLGFQ